MPRRPTPYEPTEAELAALGARLFGLPEHQPCEDATRPASPIFRDQSVASVARKETTNAKN